MSEVKDRAVTRRFDPSIVRDVAPADRPDREPEFWRARSEKTCKGCGQRFLPQARAERYCKACLASGRGWSGRKDRQPQRKLGDGRQRTAPSALTPGRQRLLASLLLDLTGPHPSFFPMDLKHGWAPDEAWVGAIRELLDRGLVVEFQAGYRITAAGILVAGPPRALCPTTDLRGRPRVCERCDDWRAREERQAA